MMGDKRFDDVKDNVVDSDDLDFSDMKINPDYYIHNAILKAQGCLVKDNMNEGFMQFRVMVENIEIMARSAKMLDDDYDKAVGEFKKCREYVEETSELVKGVKLANKKLGLVLERVFEAKTYTVPMKA